MPFEKIQLEITADKVAILTLNHPEALNAIGTQMLLEIPVALKRVATLKARCLLITGAGRAFCSGANLTDRAVDQAPEHDMLADLNMESDMGATLESTYHPILLTLKELDMPIVSAVNGVAAGVGTSFAMIADIVVAAKSAYFLQAFARIGLIPDGGATFMLPRMIGWGRAMELALLADKLPAEKACEWGLVNRVAEDDALMHDAMEIAVRLAKGPKSLTLIRKAMWESYNNSFEQQLNTERKFQREAGRSKDSAEGVRAFIEKRPAVFTGE